MWAANNLSKGPHQNVYLGVLKNLIGAVVEAAEAPEIAIRSLRSVKMHFMKLRIEVSPFGKCGREICAMGAWRNVEPMTPIDRQLLVLAAGAAFGASWSGG